MSISVTQFYSASDLFVFDTEPTTAQWNERVFALAQAELEKRWSLARGWFALPTLAINGVTDQVEISDVDGLLDGKRLTGSGAWSFTTEETGTYYLQFLADGTPSKSTTEDADYLTAGTVVWTLATTTLSDVTRTATVGIVLTGGTGNVTGDSSSVAGNLSAFADTSGKVLEDSGIAGADVSDAVSTKHAQNSDTHTTNSTFGLGGTTNLLQVSGGQMQYSIDGGANWINVSPSGTGDVVGPSSATDGHLVEFNGATGKVVKDAALAKSSVAGAVTNSHTHSNKSTLDTVTSGTVSHPSVDLADNPHGIDNTVAEWNADTIQDIPVDATPPTVGQALIYDGASYVPGNPDAGNPFDQNLDTTDSPTFDDLTLTGTLNVPYPAGTADLITGVPGVGQEDNFKVRVEDDYFGEDLDAIIFDKIDGGDDPVDGGWVFGGTPFGGSFEAWLEMRDAYLKTYKPLRFVDDTEQGTAAPLNKVDGTTAPTANDDSGDGYRVGSLWIDTTNHKVYVAEVVTVGAAVWRQVYPDVYGDANAVDAVEAAAESTAALTGASDYLLAVIGGVLKRVKADNAGLRTGTLLLGPGGWPSTTAGAAALAKSELATNKQNIQSFDFDKDTVEYVEWACIMPDDWDGGTVTAKFYWMHPATTTNFGVVWALQGRAYANDDALDQAWGTAQTVTDTGGTTSDLYISDATSALTLAGSPAGGQFVQFRGYRNATDGSDTLAVDAKLLGIRIEYGINKWSA